MVPKFRDKCIYHDGHRDGSAFKISEMSISKVERCRILCQNAKAPRWQLGRSKISFKNAEAPRKTQNSCRRARGSGGGSERFTMTQEIEMIAPRTGTKEVMKRKDENKRGNGRGNGNPSIYLDLRERSGKMSMHKRYVETVAKQERKIWRSRWALWNGCEATSVKLMQPRSACEEAGMQI